MKHVTLLFSLFCLTQLSAQNKWTVLAGSSPQPYYSPSQLTIERGDTVVWNNIEGTHNIVMTSGPEDFSFPTAGSGWTHEFVFTQLGEYHYECSVGNHSVTQFGTITVVEEQTTYTVTAGGTPDANTPAPYYSPSLLTIQVGDTVVWENIEGFHDITLVNGPDDFSYSPAGSGWTHSFVFTRRGSYDYECSVGSHSLTQFGTIIVEELATSIPTLKENLAIRVYPNPTSSKLIVDLGPDFKGSMKQYLILTNTHGKQVAIKSMDYGDSHIELDLAGYATGVYVLSLVEEGREYWFQTIVYK